MAVSGVKVDEVRRVKRVEVTFVDVGDGVSYEIFSGEVQVSVHDGVLDVKTDDGTRLIWPLARIAVAEIKKVDEGPVAG